MLKMLVIIQIIIGLAIIGTTGKYIQDYILTTPSENRAASEIAGNVGFVLLGFIVTVNGVLGIRANNKYIDMAYLVLSAVSAGVAASIFWISTLYLCLCNFIWTDGCADRGLAAMLLICGLIGCVLSVVETVAAATAICRNGDINR